MLTDLSKQFQLDIKKLQVEEKKLTSKVWDLILDIMDSSHDPYVGLGKPEPLRENLSGYYSRKVNDKHRLIYKVEGNILYLVSCFGHYNDK